MNRAEDGKNLTALGVASQRSPVLVSLSNQGIHGLLRRGTQETNPGEATNCIVRHKYVFDPSRRQYLSLADAFDYLNRRLFAGRLPQPLLTLNHGPAKVKGYYRHSSFSFRGTPWKSPIHASEISLNTKAMSGRSDTEILIELVHGMAHLCQDHQGMSRSRPGYHDAGFAEIMEQVGLIPSDTGAAGGRRTGQKMSQYVLPGGPFDLACRALLESGWRLDWEGALSKDNTPSSCGEQSTAVKANDSKTKFFCPECKQNAWAKQSAELICGHCHLRMIAATGAGSFLSHTSSQPP
jgi:predicted SprT family Zn-dependent metalloprotease